MFIAGDNSNAPERMASVQGTPEQVQQVQKLIQEIVEQVIVKRSELHFQGCHDQEKVRETLNFLRSGKSWGILHQVRKILISQ